MVGAVERKADHLQGPRHTDFFDFAGFGELALQVHMHQARQRMGRSVALAILGQLLGVEFSPTAPGCCRGVFLGEVGQLLRYVREEVCAIYFRLLNARELTAKRTELGVYDGANQRLK